VVLAPSSGVVKKGRVAVRIAVVCVSKRQPSWVSDAFTEYAKRMPREARIELIEIKPESRPDNAGSEAIAALLAKEAQRIHAAIPKRSLIVALDERGKAVTTRELSGHFAGWLESGRNVAFLIGSADGLDVALRKSAALTLSLSRLTLPHGLARVVAAEQLYRAWSLLRGHPYHRD
jgi:23S rRNA (pseudouridine1915-N3)-methyltransferase